ncbi:Alkaline ceramidase 3 [Borealophlyctis nickersoniae]|nr:Alkaline ceramidase 3 [Borealophlyctis nickersoniae]
MFPPYFHALLLSLLLSAYSIFVTVVYIHLRDPVFHQVSYGLLVAITALVPMKHIVRLSGRREGLGRRLWWMYGTSLVAYLTGFLLWNIENFNCEVFRSWRETVGYPWRVVGELHAWWHLLTGFGTYGSIVLCQYMRAITLDRRDVDIRLLCGCIPFLDKVKVKGKSQ